MAFQLPIHPIYVIIQQQAAHISEAADKRSDAVSGPQTEYRQPWADGDKAEEPSHGQTKSVAPQLIASASPVMQGHFYFPVSPSGLLPVT